MIMKTSLQERKRPFTLKRTLTIASTGIILLLALFVVQPVFAAEIVVDGTTCTLADAITAANTNTASGGCPAGDDAGGFDTIDLQTDVVLTAALPQIKSAIVLNGNGRTIDGNDSFRVLAIQRTSDFTLNDATVTGGYALKAAGIWSINGNDLEHRSVITINNSHIVGNNGMYTDTVGFFSAGGVRNGSHNLMVINNSTISDNSATILGGGVHNHSNGILTINNSTISGNTSSGNGGGISINPGSVITINNSTITQNTANDFGGGVFTQYNSTIDLNLTLIAGNDAADGAEIYATGVVTAANYNVIGYGGSARSHGFTPSGTDIIPPGPLTLILENSLKENGGPTATHKLKPNSVAKDAAPNVLCAASPANGIDQRGAARNFDLDGSATANECDIGAYELHETLSVGICGPLAPELNGLQTFNFSSGNTVTVDVNNANGLRCITVEEMGPGANHLYAAQANVADLDLETNNWWHITSNNVSGFDVDVTLPYAAADGGSRLCKWIGAANWDCANTGDSTHVENSSATRHNVSSFSDWTVGAATCPAAVTPMTSIDLIGANDTDVLLSWTDDPANSGGYTVYRSQTPYFTADATTLHATLPPASTSTIDMGAAGSANVNYFYIVRGLNGCGAASDYAQRLGAFDFGIVPGA